MIKCVGVSGPCKWNDETKILDESIAYYRKVMLHNFALEQVGLIDRFAGRI